MRISVFIFLLVFPHLGLSQVNVNLSCNGTYHIAKDKNTDELPIEGILVEISKDNVKISSAPGFSGTYKISYDEADGIGFIYEADKRYGGFINRLSGKMDLMERKKEKANADGSYHINQIIRATCSSASPLF